MPNMIDYLEQYGELTFAQKPFNDVDNAIFSTLVYIDFKNIVQNDNVYVRLSEAYKMFCSMYDKKELKEESNSKYIQKVELFELLASTKRYKNIRLSHYHEETDKETQKQFAAIHFNFYRKTKYIAFRGTDDSIIGYEEDAEFTYNFPISSQKEALKYINSTCDGEWTYYFGGHSKGGNLALYASTFAPKPIKKRIVKIYNNDGPGFPERILTEPEYLEIIPMTTTIIPESSLIGILLAHGEKFTVVKSNKIGISQHNMFEWQVDDDHFEVIKEISKTSKIFGEMLSNSIKKMDSEQVEILISSIFDTLDSTGIQSVNDLKPKRFSNIVNIFNLIQNADEIDRDLLSSTISTLFNEAFKALLPNEIVNRGSIKDMDFSEMLKDSFYKRKSERIERKENRKTKKELGA